MHYEFAIEPSSITRDYRTFHQVIEKFGFDKGLLVSAFPSKWKKEVLSDLSSHVTTIEKKRAEDLLKNISIKSGRNYNSSKQWLDAAVEAHTNHPFHAIIATNNPVSHQDIITVYSVCHEANPKCIIPHEIRISKVPTEYAKTTDLLIKNSSDIMIIDPYFYKSSHSDVLTAILQNFAGKPIQIRYFMKEAPKGESVSHRLQELNNLERIIPQGISIEFILLNNQFDMHNRYIITEKGGIKFGHSMNYDANKKDEANLMSSITRKEIYDEYDRISQTYIAHKFIVSGAL